jgi:hypothetical protein
MGWNWKLGQGKGAGCFDAVVWNDLWDSLHSI